VGGSLCLYEQIEGCTQIPRELPLSLNQVRIQLITGCSFHRINSGLVQVQQRFPRFFNSETPSSFTMSFSSRRLLNRIHLSHPPPLLPATPFLPLPPLNDPLNSSTPHHHYSPLSNPNRTFRGSRLSIRDSKCR